MMIVIAIVAMILLSRTTFGRYVYATGGNTQAARLGGVRVNAIRVATFALSGTAAALAGTLDASRVLSAQASSGQFLTFTVLTGIIVGGTSILGGEGTSGGRCSAASSWRSSPTGSTCSASTRSTSRSPSG